MTLDKESFKVLFNTLYPRLIAYSLKYIKDDIAAEEIVGDCLVTLWEKRKDLSHVDNINSYLYTMVKNASFDYLAKSKQTVSFNQDKHDSALKIDHDVIEEEVHAMLYNALDKLPSKCRKVFELSCLKGLKYKDIANDLNISINTVKSQRARAIELLKKELKNNPFLMFFICSF